MLHFLNTSFWRKITFCFYLSGQEIKKFPHKNYVTCVQFHPTDPALFLAGTFKSAILCWDARTGNVSIGILHVLQQSTNTRNSRNCSSVNEWKRWSRGRFSCCSLYICMEVLRRSCLNIKTSHPW